MMSEVSTSDLGLSVAPVLGSTCEVALRLTYLPTDVSDIRVEPTNAAAPMRDSQAVSVPAASVAARSRPASFRLRAAVTRKASHAGLRPVPAG